MGSFLDIFGGGEDKGSPPAQLPMQVYNSGAALGAVPDQVGGVNSGLLASYYPQAQQYAGFQQGLLNQFSPEYYRLQSNLENAYLPLMAEASRNASRAGDPTGFALREQLGNQLSQNLSTNGGLNPTELFNAQQDLRSGQSRLGAGQQGLSDLFDEARFLGNTRFARNQANQQASQNFLGLRAPGEQAANRMLNPTSPNTSGLLQQITPGQVLQAGQLENQSTNAMRSAFNANQNDIYNNRPPGSSDLGGYLGLAGGIVGAAAGTYFGGPQGGMMGAQLGSQVGSGFGNAFDQPSAGGAYYNGGGSGASGGGFLSGFGNLFGGGQSVGSFGGTASPNYDGAVVPQQVWF